MTKKHTPSLYPYPPIKSEVAIFGKPWLTINALLLSDALILVSFSMVAVWLRSWLDEPGSVNYSLYGQLWPVLLLFPLAFALLGLYPGVAISPPEELRRIFVGTTLVYMFLGSTTFLVKESETYSRAVFLVGWALSVVGLPVARALMRHFFAPQNWWGYPTIILGAGLKGEAVVQALKQQPRLGLKPVALLDDAPERPGDVLGVPVLGKLELAPLIAKKWGIHHAVLALPSDSLDDPFGIAETYGDAFAHLILIPNLNASVSPWVSTRELGDMLGLELRNNLLRPWDRRLKRALDLIGVTIGGLLVLPFLSMIALLIRLDSPGSALYTQERLGLNGRRFKVLKFRTMLGDGEQRLTELLESDPALKAEYQQFHKLRRDPRVTRIGAWLRRTSLDELPQLWNILLGQMSLVGPRPYLPREVEKMSGSEKVILKAPPGITGMWQVTGRNHARFHERVSMDVYYVRNWSPWLDIYLLIRTVWALVWGKGAY